MVAIYQFHHEHGLWPRDLDELVPNYLQGAIIKGWVYEPWYNGRWTLTKFGANFDKAVRLLHSSDEATEWKLDFGDKNLSLGIIPELPEFMPVASEDRMKKRRATLLARIAQHPKEILHEKGLISDYYKEGRFQDARAECLNCFDRWPDVWWTNVMLSIIDLKLQEPNRGEMRLLAWAKQHNEFIHFCLLAYYYHEARNNEKCFAALRTATDLPLTDVIVEWDDCYEHFGSLGAIQAVAYATNLAYSMEQLDLCLTLCDRWQQHADNSYGGCGFHLFRAACFLRQGKLIAAKKEIDVASVSPYARHYCETVETLRTAIETNNRSFQYTPEVPRSKDFDYWGILIDYK